MPGMASSHRKPHFGFAVARFFLCTCHFLVAAAALVQSHAEQAPKGACGPVLGKSGAGDRRAMWAWAGNLGMRGAWPRMECPGLMPEVSVPAGSLFALMRGPFPLQGTRGGCANPKPGRVSFALAALQERRQGQLPAPSACVSQPAHRDQAARALLNAPPLSSVHVRRNLIILWPIAARQSCIGL